MAKRKAKGRHQNSLSPFSAKIYCGECGELYGSKVWHSTDKYRRVVWRCNGKYERQTGCSTPHLSEKEIEMLFMRAISKLHDQRTALRCAGQPMKAVLRAWFPRCPAKRTAALTRRRKAAPTRSARGRRRCASPRRRAMWSWRRWPDGIRIFENSKNIKTERTGRLPRGVRPVRLFLCDRRHAFGAFCLPVTDSISMHQTAV